VIVRMTETMSPIFFAYYEELAKKDLIAPPNF
jgi:hypothetical protein